MLLSERHPSCLWWEVLCTLSVLLFIQFLHTYFVFKVREQGGISETIKHPRHKTRLQDLLPLNATENKSLNYSANLFFNLGLIRGRHASQGLLNTLYNLQLSIFKSTSCQTMGNMHGGEHHTLFFVLTLGTHLIIWFSPCRDVTPEFTQALPSCCVVCSYHNCYWQVSSLLKENVCSWLVTYYFNPFPVCCSLGE